MSNEGAGQTLFDATGNLNLQTTGFGSARPWGLGSAPGLACAGTSGSVGAYATLPSRLQLGLPLTLAVGFRTLGATVDYGTLLGLEYNSIHGNPYTLAAIEYANTTGGLQTE
jgi:hypothetical protein